MQLELSANSCQGRGCPSVKRLSNKTLENAKTGAKKSELLDFDFTQQLIKFKKS